MLGILSRGAIACPPQKAGLFIVEHGTGRTTSHHRGTLLFLLSVSGEKLLCGLAKGYESRDLTPQDLCEWGQGEKDAHPPWPSR